MGTCETAFPHAVPRTLQLSRVFGLEWLYTGLAGKTSETVSVYGC